MNALTALKTRLAPRADFPEFEQALLRLVILGIVLAYVAAPFSGRANATTVAFLAACLAVAVGIFAAICRWPAASASRRVVGMVADVAAITFGLFLAGSQGGLLFGMYLLIIFGNGLRYGRVYLHASQLLCLAGFLLVFRLVPWWQNNPFTGVGLLIALIVLPFYVSSSAELIKAERAKAEQALKECLEQEGRSG